MRKFVIGSGYFDDGSGWAGWFHANVWQPCARSAGASAIKIIAVGGSVPIVGESNGVIRLTGNLGHVHNTLGKTEPKKDHRFCGWSAGLIALAMIAYNDESDLIFVEQDCAVFGPWVERLYQELGNGGMIFGKSKCMPCAQSLILIRHWFIPQFIVKYMGDADERLLRCLPERRFVEMLSIPAVRQFSFGCDRDRPIPISDEVFYAQKLTRDELLILRDIGKLDFIGEPPDVKTFTGKS